MPLKNSLCAALAAGAFAALLAGCSKHRPEAPPPAASAVSVAADVTPESVPPPMVGVWTSTRGDTMRCIELHADGVYVMVPNTDAGDHTTYHGTWRIGGDQVTWRDASQNYRPDVNPMVEVTDGHFVTIEADRSQTKFDRIAGPAASCPRS